MNADDQSSLHNSWPEKQAISTFRRVVPSRTWFQWPSSKATSRLSQGAGDRVSGFLGGAAKSYAGTYKDEDHTEVPLCVAHGGSAAYWCWLMLIPWLQVALFVFYARIFIHMFFCSLIVRICNAKIHLNVNHVEYSNPWLSDRPGLCRADGGQTWRYRHGTLEPGWPTSS